LYIGSITNKSSSRWKYWLIIAVGIILLVIAIKSRGTYSAPYYGLFTNQITGLNIAGDYPYPETVLIKHAFDVMGFFLRFHIVPAFFLILSIAAFWLGASKLTGFKTQCFINKIFICKWLPAFLLVVTFFLILWVRFYIFLDYPLVGDEFSYLFQAKIFASGRLYVEPPPNVWHFTTGHIVNDCRWYSKYTAGWPLILTIGEFFNLTFLIPPLISVLCVYFLYRLSLKLWGSSSAVMAVLFALASPVFVLLGASYLNHVATGTTFLIAFLAVLETRSSVLHPGGWKKMIPGGIALTVALLLRPLDGGILFICLSLWIIILAQMEKNYRRWISPGLVLLGGLVLGVGLLLTQNYFQVGDLFTLGFLKYNPNERLGFGVFGHTPVMGLWNIFFANIRSAFWMVPLLMILSVAALFRRWQNFAGAVLVIIMVNITMIGYYSLGLAEYGSRYYFSTFLCLIVIAAGGIKVIALWFKKRFSLSRVLFGPIIILAMIVFMIFANYSLIYPNVHNTHKHYRVPVLTTRQSPRVVRPAIVLIRIPGFAAWGFTRNHPDYNNQDVLLAAFLLPEQNKQLLESFPDRTPYVLEYIPGKGFSIEPYNRYDEPTPLDYLHASYNYPPRFENMKIDLLKEGKKRFKDPHIQRALAMAYYNKGSWAEAQQELVSAIKNNPDDPELLYLLGRCLGNQGDYPGAIKVLRELLEEHPESSLKDKAGQWLEYYQAKRLPQ